MLDWQSDATVPRSRNNWRKKIRSNCPARQTDFRLQRICHARRGVQQSTRRCTWAGHKRPSTLMRCVGAAVWAVASASLESSIFDQALDQSLESGESHPLQKVRPWLHREVPSANASVVASPAVLSNSGDAVTVRVEHSTPSTTDW